MSAQEERHGLLKGLRQAGPPLSEKTAARRQDSEEKGGPSPGLSQA